MKKFYRPTSLRVLFGVGAVLFAVTGLMSLAIKDYGIAYMRFFIAVLWLIVAYIYKNPYVTVDNDKIVYCPNAFTSREHLISNLQITMNKPNKMAFQDKVTGQKVMIYLSAIDKSNREELRDILINRTSRV